MSGSKVEEIKFYSDILKKEMGMLVYLPENYDKTALPVLYFLHGRNGNENIMYAIDMNTKADRLIQSGEIKPMIIVCPRIENSRGINSSLFYEEVTDEASGRIINLGMYEDYFIKEVLPKMENSFNTIKEKSGRYIGGASAGGYTALHHAFLHQDMFSKVGGHMPALELVLDDDAKPFYADIDSWNTNDPIYIASNSNISNELEVYLDAGDKDEGRFYEGCSALQKILQEKGIKSQNHIFQVNHSVEYIQSNLEKYLKFYGN